MSCYYRDELLLQQTPPDQSESSTQVERVRTARVVSVRHTRLTPIRRTSAAQSSARGSLRSDAAHAANRGFDSYAISQSRGRNARALRDGNRGNSLGRNGL